MVQEVETQADPLSQSVPTQPVIEVAPDEAQPLPTAAEEVPAETEVATQEEAPPWAGVRDKEELREHVGDFLEDAERKGYEKRTEEFDSYAAPHLQELTRRLDVTNTNAGRMLKDLRDLAKAAKDGALDADSLGEWSESHKRTFDAMAAEWETPDGIYPYTWRYYGAQEAIRTIAQAAGEEALGQTFAQRLGRVAQGMPDANLFKDLSKKLTEKADQSGYDRGFKEGKKAAEAASVEKVKAQTRETEGPNRAPGTAGGGTGYSKEQLSKMSPQQIAALPDDVVDRALAGR